MRIFDKPDGTDIYFPNGKTEGRKKKLKFFTLYIEKNGNPPELRKRITSGVWIQNELAQYEVSFKEFGTHLIIDSLFKAEVFV